MKEDNDSQENLSKLMIIHNVRLYEDKDKFNLLLEGLGRGLNIRIETGNNSLYNNGWLRASQKGIRQEAAREEIFGLGQPEQPVAKLVRCQDRKGKFKILVIVLNGHHRTGNRVLNNEGVNLDILLAEDLVNNFQEVRSGVNFDDPAVMDKYGLKSDPRKIKYGYGFNTIVSKLITFRIVGEAPKETRPDPINNIK
ncbi:MAG: hypothetical protein U0946_05410 [Patescibacteria group bacterium]|nr:hypothetical protein [Patescibacteria group bacterium]